MFKVVLRGWLEKEIISYFIPTEKSYNTTTKKYHALFADIQHVYIVPLVLPVSLFLYIHTQLFSEPFACRMKTS